MTAIILALSFGMQPLERPLVTTLMVYKEFYRQSRSCQVVTDPWGGKLSTPRILVAYGYTMDTEQ